MRLDRAVQAPRDEREREERVAGRVRVAARPDGEVEQRRQARGQRARARAPPIVPGQGGEVERCWESGWDGMRARLPVDEEREDVAGYLRGEQFEAAHVVGRPRGKRTGGWCGRGELADRRYLSIYLDNAKLKL